MGREGILMSKNSGKLEVRSSRLRGDMSLSASTDHVLRLET